jgi:hypothetical protein
VCDVRGGDVRGGGGGGWVVLTCSGVEVEVALGGTLGVKWGKKEREEDYG